MLLQRLFLTGGETLRILWKKIIKTGFFQDCVRSFILLKISTTRARRF
jgi:hypothetical protein